MSQKTRRIKSEGLSMVMVKRIMIQRKKKGNRTSIMTQKKHTLKDLNAFQMQNTSISGQDSSMSISGQTTLWPWYKLTKGLPSLTRSIVSTCCSTSSECPRLIIKTKVRMMRSTLSNGKNVVKSLKGMILALWKYNINFGENWNRSNLKQLN